MADLKLRTTPLSLASDGLTIVQPPPAADSGRPGQQGAIVARVEPAYADSAPSIVRAINDWIGAIGRPIEPEDTPYLGTLSFLELMRAEIVRDFTTHSLRSRAGVTPTADMIAGIGDLHDYCDANEYADTHPDCIAAMATTDRDNGDHFCEFHNAVTDQIDKWIKVGGLLRAVAEWESKQG